MSVKSAFLAAVALFALASLDGVQAGTYDDMVAKQQKSMERAAAKMAKLQACAADPKPCAEADAAKAQKAMERAKAKLEKANATLAASN